MASLTGVSSSDIQADIHIVQNTPSVVHVALPHYSSQEDSATYSRKMLSDKEMAQISGGEVGFTIAAVVTALGIGTAAVIATGVAVELTRDPDEEVYSQSNFYPDRRQSVGCSLSL